MQNRSHETDPLRDFDGSRNFDAMENILAKSMA